ncbi:juvenile hormone esterase-like isoform X2 [Hyposmocoma kahamanoa]|nr:juvenile hormone esterase-like isoform X2 [Hyposmocoma kahamanoa]XP_026315292.1 juvenile hormone esterase-like isoform X2 [Hyposmocoma kahamanoa]
MPFAQIEQGKLRGVVCENNEGKYLAFKGIPYAKPPVGILRFKAPEPPEPWEGVLDASEHGPVCPQFNERLNRMETGSEDCLYLNVYTPGGATASPRLLPVMVWIHGGAFYTGSGNSDFYGPEFFMAHDVIFVTFNYRLEVLGFLCLDNEDIPGNAGLKDQVEALKWVKKNIFAFGGDPNNITIFGCSAGGSCASYHLISKMSEGLFNKAIFQSGVCLSDWSYDLNARNRAFQLGKLLGKETEDPTELSEFLRSIPASSLVKISLPTEVINNIEDVILWRPVIEKSDLDVVKFITEQPPDLVTKGQIVDVPIILGYTSGDGIEISRNLPSLLDKVGKIGYFVPRELKLKWSSDKLEEVDKIIRKFYFNGEDVTMDKLQAMTDLETCRLFSYNIQRWAKYHSRYSSQPVFLYKFCAETERNIVKKSYDMNDIRGVCHADDLHYLFHVTCLDVPLTDDSRAVIKNFVRLWTTFACTGTPTTADDFEQWKPFKESERNCYIIDKKLKCVQDEDAEVTTFWEQIYGEENTCNVNGIS